MVNHTDAMFRIYGRNNDFVRGIYAEEHQIPLDQVDDAIDADDTIVDPVTYVTKQEFEGATSTSETHLLTHKAWNSICDFSMPVEEGVVGKRIEKLDFVVETVEGTDAIIDYSLFMESSTTDFVLLIKKEVNGKWVNVTRNIGSKVNHGDATPEHAYNNSSTPTRISFKVIDDRTTTGSTTYGVFVKCSKLLKLSVNRSINTKDTETTNSLDKLTVT